MKSAQPNEGYVSDCPVLPSSLSFLNHSFLELQRLRKTGKLVRAEVYLHGLLSHLQILHRDALQNSNSVVASCIAQTMEEYEQYFGKRQLVPKEKISNAAATNVRNQLPLTLHHHNLDSLEVELDATVKKIFQSYVPLETVPSPQNKFARLLQNNSNNNMNATRRTHEHKGLASNATRIFHSATFNKENSTPSHNIRKDHHSFFPVPGEVSSSSPATKGASGAGVSCPFQESTSSKTTWKLPNLHPRQIFYGTSKSTSSSSTPSNSSLKNSTRYKTRFPSSRGDARNISRKEAQADQHSNNDLPVEDLFVSAHEKLYLDNDKTPPPRPATTSRTSSTSTRGKRHLLGGLGKRKRDKSPALNNDKSEKDRHPLLDDPRLQHLEEKMIERVLNEVLSNHIHVSWDDIAGLDFAKKSVKEMIILPMLRPEIFTGLRAPPKGLLLFGPPGTGKTLIAKAIATESTATFFSISASSLTSKWIGEAEKMVTTLFAVARCFPSPVIFIDEIDSLLTSRSDQEQESSRRIKTQFLVEMDGAAVTSKDNLLVIGATNRPQDLDEALRRRMSKRLYIPLPNEIGRESLIRRGLQGNSHSLTDEEISLVIKKTKGYSGSDLRGFLQEAAMGPIRDMHTSVLRTISPDDIPPISYHHFLLGLKQARASVSETDLKIYREWNRKYGSFGDIQSHTG